MSAWKAAAALGTRRAVADLRPSGKAWAKDGSVSGGRSGAESMQEKRARASRWRAAFTWEVSCLVREARRWWRVGMVFEFTSLPGFPSTTTAPWIALVFSLKKTDRVCGIFFSGGLSSSSRQFQLLASISTISF
jgi:hypothetical protein